MDSNQISRCFALALTQVAHAQAQPQNSHKRGNPIITTTATRTDGRFTASIQRAPRPEHHDGQTDGATIPKDIDQTSTAISSGFTSYTLRRWESVGQAFCIAATKRRRNDYRRLHGDIAQTTKRQHVRLALKVDLAESPKDSNPTAETPSFRNPPKKQPARRGHSRGLFTIAP
jgi:hypothetical protein